MKIQSGGLYHPDQFKDNCGFGLIAQMKGIASHELLQTAIEALTCMTHRGGIAADGKTGDGCGLLLQMPDKFYRAVAKEAFGKDLSKQFAVGMTFLSQDTAKAQHARTVLEDEVSRQSLEVVGWRKVPFDSSVCGRIAMESLPLIEQLFLNSDGISDTEINRRLFFARRRAEARLQEDEDFYIPSLSATVVSYKGLVMPADLPSFYKDLANPEMGTAICVFHQRFSTNTLPRWPLAQPFRYLAHNGEINTIMGNRNWSVARTPKFVSDLLPNLDEILPLVNRTGSDSSSLDNMLELLLAGGMDIYRAVRCMVPPAWQNVETMDADLRAFYEYNSMHMEPWDGPAGLVMTDGRHAICMLDRNGLRPARWVITKNGFITLASEIGVYSYKPDDVVAKGRVGPGQILVVDTETGELLHTDEVDQRLKSAQPYKQWLKENVIRIQDTLTDETRSIEQLDPAAIKTYQKLFQVTFEERDQVIRPVAESGQEAVGSMGDDTPMAVLSAKVRPLYDFFRQQFAQVTNPPIDPLREAVVMSLETCVGAERNVFEQTAEHADRAILTSPVLSHSKFQQLLSITREGYQVQRLSLNYDAAISLRQAVENICTQAEEAVRSGKVILVLSDRDIDEKKLPLPALMATGAVHHHLTGKGLRCDSNIIVETAGARDPHHFACLIGFGATAVYPYLAFDVICDLVRTGEILMDPIDAQKNFRKAIDKGLLKILSKMGISTVASYRGAQLFEAVGIAMDVVDTCFLGVQSRIQGAGFTDFENDAKL